MLTDQEEDKKTNPLNPLRIALRRRNVKTVQFAAPSYVEPSDNGMTSEDEDEANGEDLAPEENGVANQQEDTVQQAEENGAVQSGHVREEEVNGRSEGVAENQDLRNGDDSASVETSRTSEEGADRSGMLGERRIEPHADFRIRRCRHQQVKER